MAPVEEQVEKRFFTSVPLLVAGALSYQTTTDISSPAYAMFTLEQIKAIHSQVKSGADFPQYVQNLKAIGLACYNLYVADGHAEYVGSDGVRLTSPATAALLPVAPTSSSELLAQALAIHQQGHTDYPTFCRQAADAGVEKWTVDTQLLTCTYYDQQGKVLVTEPIPMP